MFAAAAFSLLAACGEISALEVATPSDPAPPVPDSDPPPEPSVDGPVAGPEDPPPAPPAVAFNEVQTDNDSTVMDGDLVFSDWVEIVNASDEVVSLDRLAVSLDGGAPASLGAGDLAPGQIALFWADGRPDPGHLPFPLDPDGVSIELSLDGAAIDRIATGEMAGDTTWARFPDGGDWAVTARPTPGETNGNAPTASTDPSDQLFRTDRIHDLWIEIPDAGWASLTREPYEEIEGSLGYRRAWFSSVGVRIKGQLGSLRTLDQKAALKIDLNAYDDHRLLGQETLTLNNMVQDPTYVAEHLAYTLFRAVGVPAPRVGWSRVYVNREYFGLYAVMETVDDTFLKRWYADDSGALYEGAYGVDFEVGGEFEFEYDEGPDPDDRSDITAVAEVLDLEATDANLAALEALIDLDEFLAEIAVESLILHWDGYTTANNYRLYHDPVSDRFDLLPWGTDQTFVDYWYWPWDGWGRVFLFCLENPGCAARYDATLLAAADTMDALDLEVEMDQALSLLAAEIAADPRAESSASTHASFVETMRGTLREWPAEVRSLVEVP